MYTKNSLLRVILIRFMTLIEIILETVSKKNQEKNVFGQHFFLFSENHTYDILDKAEDYIFSSLKYMSLERQNEMV